MSQFVNYTLQSYVYLAGFRLHNSEGMSNYLAATVSSAALSPVLNYVFKTA